MTKLEYALSYAKRGWHVFPLAPGTKVPLKGSRGLYDATIDESQITKWWTENPDYNIGIRTGKISNLTVIDFDTEEAAQKICDLANATE